MRKRKNYVSDFDKLMREKYGTGLSDSEKRTLYKRKKQLW